jgi:hypothetical protein
MSTVNTRQPAICSCSFNLNQYQSRELPLMRNETSPDHRVAPLPPSQPETDSSLGGGWKAKARPEKPGVEPAVVAMETSRS